MSYETALQKLDNTMAKLHQIAAGLEELKQEINAEHPVVREFWNAYRFMNGSESAPRLNHSRNEKLIAVSLPHFLAVAADLRRPVPSLSELKRHLKTSRTHQFIGVRSVNSTINARYNAHRFPGFPAKPAAVKVWIFQA